MRDIIKYMKMQWHKKTFEICIYSDAQEIDININI